MKIKKKWLKGWIKKYVKKILLEQQQSEAAKKSVKNYVSAIGEIDNREINPGIYDVSKDKKFMDEMEFIKKGFSTQSVGYLPKQYIFKDFVSETYTDIILSEFETFRDDMNSANTDPISDPHFPSIPLSGYLDIAEIDRSVYLLIEIRDSPIHHNIFFQIASMKYPYQLKYEKNIFQHGTTYAAYKHIL